MRAARVSTTDRKARTTGSRVAAPSRVISGGSRKPVLKRNVLVVGSSGHAAVVVDCLEKQGLYRVVGWVDSFRLAGVSAFGYEVLGAEQDVPTLMREFDVWGVVVAIGDNWARSQVVARLVRRVSELRFPVVVHPAAQIARGVTVGDGSVVLAGAIINSKASVGRWCILNTKSSLDHESIMGDFASLAPAATTGGRVTIGGYSAIGLGASVIQGLRIGDHSVIGAGAVVVKDIQDHVVAYGVPAQVQRARAAGEPYL